MGRGSVREGTNGSILGAGGAGGAVGRSDRGSGRPTGPEAVSCAVSGTAGGRRDGRREQQGSAGQEWAADAAAGSSLGADRADAETRRCRSRSQARTRSHPWR
ncbi:hypothetical protein GCM10010498_44300 [Streptomyces cavourensis]|nr:hypothetical protein GCM10010498_44300 [Streptomyces cavourensis]